MLIFLRAYILTYLFSAILVEENFSKDTVHLPFLWMRCTRFPLSALNMGLVQQWSNPWSSTVSIQNNQTSHSNCVSCWDEDGFGAKDWLAAWCLICKGPKCWLWQTAGTDGKDNFATFDPEEANRNDVSSLLILENQRAVLEEGF